MFTEMSCIVSIRSFCRPEWIRVSRVNSKTSQSVAKERDIAKIRIAARKGDFVIRFVFCRTWIIESAVKPKAIEAVNVMMKLHHQRPEKKPRSSPRVRRP